MQPYIPRMLRIHTLAHIFRHPRKQDVQAVPIGGIVLRHTLHTSRSRCCGFTISRRVAKRLHIIVFCRQHIRCSLHEANQTMSTQARFYHTLPIGLVLQIQSDRHRRAIRARLVRCSSHCSDKVLDALFPERTCAARLHKQLVY